MAFETRSYTVVQAGLKLVTFQVLGLHLFSAETRGHL